MEKFVFWFGYHNENDFKPAADVLHRNKDEVKEFFQFDFASLLTFRLSCNIVKKIHRGSKTIIQIGNFLPKGGWIEFLKSNFKTKYNLQDFKGNGIVFVIDSEKKEVDIILEPWGRRVVYYTIKSSPIIISNEMKGIIALDRSIASIDNIDEVAMATLIGLHQFYGTQTIFNNVKLLRSGTIVRIDIRGIHLELIQNFQYYEDYLENKSFEGLTQEISALLQKIMTLEVREKKASGLLLSGGMDSGLLLCALPKDLREGFRCINFGNKYVTDVKRARALVELLGGHYCLYELFPKHILGKNAFRHIWLTEGQSPSSVAFIEPISAQEPGGIITGNPGDFNLGGSWSDKLTSYTGPKGDLRKMVRKMMMRSEYLNLLLGKEKGEEYLKFIEDAVLNAISLEKSKNQKVSIEKFVLKNRMLRHTNMGIVPVAEQKYVEEPYFVDEVISNTLEIPIHYRSDRKLQAAAISTLSSKASQFRWLQPKRKDKSFKKRIMNLTKKVPILRNIGRKILYRRMASEFEDSYVPINTWIRENEDYRNFIEDILLGTRAQSRGIFNHDGVLKLLKQHISGEANHMGKLLNLVDLEIFFQLFVDGDGFKNPPNLIQNMDPPEVIKFPGYET
ncbi:MAG: asparagine synthase-related protein [Candidatus Thorarchaeota archaeon]